MDCIRNINILQTGQWELYYSHLGLGTELQKLNWWFCNQDVAQGRNKMLSEFTKRQTFGQIRTTELWQIPALNSAGLVSVCVCVFL